jgi:hypothetical protein
MKKIIAFAALFFVAGCGNGRVTAQKAYVFERKTLPGNKLFLKYTYKNGSRIVNDSCVVNNMIIPQDSISIMVLTGSTPFESSKL